MANDPDLMAFGRWRRLQPDAERSGLVFAANDHAAKSCPVWWPGPTTDFLDRMRAQARARGITLLVNRAPYSRQQLQQARERIWGARQRLRQLGSDLQLLMGPAPEFFGLTVMGVVSGDEKAEQLPPDLAVSARRELAGLLRDSQLRLDHVRIEYGGVVPLRPSPRFPAAEPAGSASFAHRLRLTSACRATRSARPGR